MERKTTKEDTVKNLLKAILSEDVELSKSSKKIKLLYTEDMIR